MVYALEKNIKWEEIGLSLRIHGGRFVHFRSEVKLRASDWLLAFLIFRLNPNIMLYLLVPLEYWDYRHALSHSVYVVLGIEPRALNMLGKHSTNVVTSLSTALVFLIGKCNDCNMYIGPQDHDSSAT